MKEQTKTEIISNAAVLILIGLAFLVVKLLFY